eukprot:TRINITY_DN88175_c0_g1_i1.p1 TRINITY_DN88175_c0_g1~~TRINITY_DN88175_c0_g1_i1.p1  ORF type:complete len:412 (-),score=59.26 TRINITY_DN88175_c0_g1_i1:140-1321(-)
MAHAHGGNCCQSTAWRIRTVVPIWKWDVMGLTFSGSDGDLEPARVIDSGNASEERHGGYEGYDAEGCVRHGRLWGGRADENGFLWIGAEFDEPVQVHGAKFKNTGEEHEAPWVVLERRVGPDMWDIVKTASGSPDAAGEVFVVPPSKMPDGSVHTCSYTAALCDPRETPFEPDPDFYLSENCEGLWVCVSKGCGEETLHRACKLVRAAFKPEVRELWGQFRSWKGCADPGPMRIIVLDNRTDEYAGMIPELNNDWKTRNGTGCPFVVTSREDFHGGIASWKEGQLTLHEGFHGLDMVLRQLVDPYLHCEVQDLYDKYVDKFRNSGPEKCYASTNRDEFIAECFCILQDRLKGPLYEEVGLDSSSALQEQMPEVAELLGRFVNFPLDAEAVFSD